MFNVCSVCDIIVINAQNNWVVVADFLGGLISNSNEGYVADLTPDQKQEMKTGFLNHHRVTIMQTVGLVALVLAGGWLFPGAALLVLGAAVVGTIGGCETCALIDWYKTHCYHVLIPPDQNLGFF
ncbi:MAG: hypothetical protein HW387_1264 [Parachlamydiales bacterium]|nr:hypothetical protein [Parachlamydiales bacterium]